MNFWPKNNFFLNILINQKVTRPRLTVMEFSEFLVSTVLFNMMCKGDISSLAYFFLQQASSATILVDFEPAHRGIIFEIVRQKRNDKRLNIVYSLPTCNDFKKFIYSVHTILITHFD